MLKASLGSLFDLVLSQQDQKGVRNYQSLYKEATKKKWIFCLFKNQQHSKCIIDFHNITAMLKVHAQIYLNKELDVRQQKKLPSLQNSLVKIQKEATVLSFCKQTVNNLRFSPAPQGKLLCSQNMAIGSACQNNTRLFWAALNLCFPSRGWTKQEFQCPFFIVKTHTENYSC